MPASWLKPVKNRAMNRSPRTRPTQFYLCKMHNHQIRQSKSRFAEVPFMIDDLRLERRAWLGVTCKHVPHFAGQRPALGASQIINHKS
jgi:hypothetical protein